MNKYLFNVFNMRTYKDETISVEIKSEKDNYLTYYSICVSSINDDTFVKQYNDLSTFFNDYILSRSSIILLLGGIKEQAFEMLASYIGRYPTSGKAKKYSVLRKDKSIVDNSVYIDFDWTDNDKIIINFSDGYKSYYNPTIKDFDSMFDISSDTEFSSALIDLLAFFEKLKTIDARYFLRNKRPETIHGKNKYPTIVIIGPTKYAKQFRTSAQYFQILGYVVLTTFIYDGIDGKPCSQAMQDMFEELGCQRIDMADEVFVINVDGYIGDSTKKELEYAKSIGKPISYYTEKF